MACVDLVDRLLGEAAKVEARVGVDVFTLELYAPDVVVYAVVDVNPTRLAVGAASEVDPDQTVSHCLQFF